MPGSTSAHDENQGNRLDMGNLEKINRMKMPWQAETVVKSSYLLQPSQLVFAVQVRGLKMGNLQKTGHSGCFCG